MLISDSDLTRANRAPRIGQGRFHSFLEACAGTAIGFALSLALQQFVITPLFHTRTSVGENILITLAFTVLSILRGYGVRRLFNWWHCRGNA